MSTVHEGKIEFEGLAGEQVVVDFVVEVTDAPCEEAMYGEYLRRFTLSKGDEVLAKYGEKPGEWDVRPDLDFDYDAAMAFCKLIVDFNNPPE